MRCFTEHIQRECIIDGKRINYDVCHSGSLKEAKKYYGDRFKYIGSSHIYLIDGTKNISETLYHFFVKNMSYNTIQNFVV